MFFIEAAVDPSLKPQDFTWARAVRTISFWTWFFLAWAGMYLALSYSFDVREEQQRAAEIRERAHVAQLRALHSQINPHFLFNSLNSVSALILDGSVDRAEEMVTKLARFLRLGLAADPTDKIALAPRSSCSGPISRSSSCGTRISGRHFASPTNSTRRLVPALILQPIVENAVKYGVAGARPPASISIKAVDVGHRLAAWRCSIAGRARAQASGGGIGLANVQPAARLIYGEDRFVARRGKGRRRKLPRPSRYFRWRSHERRCGS